MKVAILAFALGPLSAKAVRLEARTPTDADIFNFALTLKHVQVAFHTEGLNNYTQADFTNAGIPEGTRNQFVEILEQQKAHVTFIEKLLGERAVQPCTYTFPVDSSESFAKLSQVIANVATSAYTAAISGLSLQYITSFVSILGTEARQAALLSAYVDNVDGLGNPFNIPLTKNQVFTLISPFIHSCPESNPPLVGIHANPPLTFPSYANPGDTVPIQFTADVTRMDERLYAVFLFGLNQIVVPVENGEVSIPQELAGQVYCLISTSRNGVTDGSTVAGPAILTFEYTLTGDYIPNK